MSDTGRFAALARAVVDAQDEARATAGTRDRARVRAELLRRAEVPTRARWPFVVLPLAAAVVLALLFLRPGAALTYAYGDDGEAAVVGAWLAAPPDRAETLRFSDGSEIDLHPRTRARVTGLEADTATVVLESGAADVRIESGQARRWHVHAGPYRVEVTGTAFALAWDPVDEALDLELREGSVLVVGPGLDAPRRVSAGEELHVGGRAEVAVAPARAAAAIDAEAIEPETIEAEAIEPHVDAPVGLDAAEPPARDEPRPRSRPARGDREAPPDPAPAPAIEPEADADAWREPAARGRWREALDAAKAHGFAAHCERLSAHDLLQLADVARFAREPARAIEALRAVRRRFPDSDAAAMAAFERARIAKASSSAYPEAVRWFSTYLRERPEGPLAREALAGLMEVQAPDAARQTATRYLDRFPKGPHADVARRLLDASNE